MSLVVDEILLDITWAIEDLKTRSDDFKGEGNYSPELERALRAIEKLKVHQGGCVISSRFLNYLTNIVSNLIENKLFSPKEFLDEVAMEFQDE